MATYLFVIYLSIWLKKKITSMLKIEKLFAVKVTL